MGLQCSKSSVLLFGLLPAYCADLPINQAHVASSPAARPEESPTRYSCEQRERLQWEKTTTTKNSDSRGSGLLV